MTVVADKLIELWKPNKYYFGCETSKQGVEHLQCHLEFEGEPPNKDKRSKDYKKIDELIGQTTLKYFNEVLTTNERNLIYCAKECQPIRTSLSEEELQILHDEEEEINEDKKKDIKEKLLDAIRPRMKEGMTFSDVSLIIMNIYINDYNKLPPNRSLMFQYVLYVCWKLGIGNLVDFEYAYRN